MGFFSKFVFIKHTNFYLFDLVNLKVSLRGRFQCEQLGLCMFYMTNIKLKKLHAVEKLF